jgi:hypothetical protein
VPAHSYSDSAMIRRDAPLHHVLMPIQGGISVPGIPNAMETITPEEKAQQLLEKRISLLAGHMTHQSSLHEKAMENTRRLFNELLDELPAVCQLFTEALGSRRMETGRVYSEVDPDRSIGVLNVLWHCLSFTSRGNTKPLALHRTGGDPQFTGRILAIRGDFQDLAHRYETTDFTDLLPFELASLYVPADPFSPAILRVPHLGLEEEYLDQRTASRVFVMKTVEMVCSGGFLHEQ